MAKVTLDMETFKALASQTRLDVLRALDERRKTLSELAKQLELNKATVHEHLQLLLATGLIKKRDDEGRKWIYYELTWSGERLLHPEDTTTFAILLGLSTAAAGGGLAMLGRALEWWWTGRQLQGEPEGAPGGGGGAADDASAPEQADTVASDAENDAADPSAQSSTDSGTSTSSQTGSSSANQTHSSSEPAGAGQGSSSAQTATTTDTQGDGGTVDELRAGGEGNNTGGDGLSASDTQTTFLDDGGWLAIALFTTAVLLVVLAWVVRRGRRRKRE